MKKEKKINYRKSVKITEDIWFYPNPKSFDFIVWVKIGSQKQAAQFRLTHKKIARFLPPPNKYMKTQQKEEWEKEIMNSDLCWSCRLKARDFFHHFLTQERQKAKQEKIEILERIRLPKIDEWDIDINLRGV